MSKKLSEKEYEEFKENLKKIGGEDILKAIEVMENEGIPYVSEGDLKEFDFTQENTKVVKVK